MVKKETTHQRADHLSRLTHGEEPQGVDDDLPDAYLFNLEMVPRWAEDVIPFLTFGMNLDERSSELDVRQARSFKLIAGRLYKWRRWNTSIVHWPKRI